MGRRQAGVGEASSLCPLARSKARTLRLHRSALYAISLPPSCRAHKENLVTESEEVDLGRQQGSIGILPVVMAWRREYRLEAYATLSASLRCVMLLRLSRFI